MMKRMNIQQAYEYIKEHRPEVVHLSGKTSTGKTTFAHRLSQDFDYEIIELDQIVHSAVIAKHHLNDEGQIFVEVYKNRDRTDLIDSFIRATEEKIALAKASGHPAIIDGAVANPQTLKELLGEVDSIIVYLHPASLSNYCRNLINRFKTATPDNNAGLPAKFWALIDPAEFAKFCKNGRISSGLQRTIEQYAVESQAESLKRLQSLKDNFTNILIVDV
jgi:adenylate kinase family enzyme